VPSSWEEKLRSLWLVHVFDCHHLLPFPISLITCCTTYNICLLQSGPWKRKCLADFGIVTQCLAPTRVNDNYLNNVLLKINAKVCWYGPVFPVLFSAFITGYRICLRYLSFRRLSPSLVGWTHCCKSKYPVQFLLCQRSLLSSWAWMCHTVNLGSLIDLPLLR
jgi:hypothetical protein